MRDVDVAALHFQRRQLEVEITDEAARGEFARSDAEAEASLAREEALRAKLREVRAQLKEVRS